MSKKSPKITQSSKDQSRASINAAKDEEKRKDLLSKQNALTEREDILSQKEGAVKKLEQDLKLLETSLTKKEADLNDKQLRLTELELQAKNGFPKLFEETFSTVKQQIEDREKKSTQEWESIEIEKDKLRTREFEIQKAEVRRDLGYTDERKALDSEIIAGRSKSEQKITKQSKKRLEELENEISDERNTKFRDPEVSPW
jgi:hypothetical protein